MFEVSKIWSICLLIELYGANMNLIKGQHTKPATILLYSYKGGLRGTCQPQRAMDGLNYASKQEP